MEDDFLLEDEDNIYEDGYYDSGESEEDSEDELDNLLNDKNSEDEDGGGHKVDVSAYKGKLTENELWLCGAYDDIVKSEANVKDTYNDTKGYLMDAVVTILKANPVNTSAATRNKLAKELLKQGHHRIINSIYTPDTQLSGKDVDIDFFEDSRANQDFNTKFTQDARNQIARFVDYLANRDLSKDSTNSRNRKMRQLPAFIIFLFSSGMYDLILNCPTMPKVYDDQINKALAKIVQSKYDIVEDLAVDYEKAGRQAVADRVRKLQLAWFNKEPMQILTSKFYKDLNLTYDDVAIYKKHRRKYNNISKNITQEDISDLIEVYVSDKGIYQKLKDKTKSIAIDEVKELWLKWSKENPIESSDLAERIVFKDINEE